jgi:hypothetical protein
MVIEIESQGHDTGFGTGTSSDKNSQKNRVKNMKTADFLSPFCRLPSCFREQRCCRAVAAERPAPPALSSNDAAMHGTDPFSLFVAHPRLGIKVKTASYS